MRDRYVTGVGDWPQRGVNRRASTEGDPRRIASRARKVQGEVDDVPSIRPEEADQVQFHADRDVRRLAWIDEPVIIKDATHGLGIIDKERPVELHQPGRRTVAGRVRRIKMERESER